MTSILEEFAYGNISPDVQTFKKDSEFGRVMELLASTEQALLDRLGAADRELMDKYIHAQGEANRLTADKNLIYGYKLGLIMTAEAFAGMDELYLGGQNP